MNKKGFTLIELMVVVLIISIIAALVGPTIFKKIGKSKQVAAQAQIEMFGMALDSYRLDNDVYPSTEQGGAALIEKPSIPPIPENWDGPYLKKDIPMDPWGNPYRYTCPGNVNPTSYDLLSYGADGKEEGEGDAKDIVSWKGLGK
ncbi:MAG: type II secretion system major pseudopilin GspG [Candidatus Desantisbacteria bacterium]